jgi:ABC-type phosphate transport system permease subunit
MKHSHNEISQTVYEKNKALKQSGFKASLIIGVSIVVTFFILIILFLSKKGLSGFTEFADLNFNYFLSGNYYDLYAGVLPGGLLVVNTI